MQWWFVQHSGVSWAATATEPDRTVRHAAHLAYSLISPSRSSASTSATPTSATSFSTSPTASSPPTPTGTAALTHCWTISHAVFQLRTTFFFWFFDEIVRTRRVQDGQLRDHAYRVLTGADRCLQSDVIPIHVLRTSAWRSEYDFEYQGGSTVFSTSA